MTFKDDLFIYQYDLSELFCEKKLIWNENKKGLKGREQNR